MYIEIIQSLMSNHVQPMFSSVLCFSQTIRCSKKIRGIQAATFDPIVKVTELVPETLGRSGKKLPILGRTNQKTSIPLKKLGKCTSYIALMLEMYGLEFVSKCCYILLYNIPVLRSKWPLTQTVSKRLDHRGTLLWWEDHRI